MVTTVTRFPPLVTLVALAAWGGATAVQADDTVAAMDRALANVVAGKSYRALRERAIAEDRPLVVWVDYVCPPCEAKLADCLHYHCASFDGIRTSGVVVARPRGKNLYRVWASEESPRVEEIREATRTDFRTADDAEIQKAEYRERPPSARVYEAPRVHGRPVGVYPMNCPGGNCGGAGSYAPAPLMMSAPVMMGGFGGGFGGGPVMMGGFGGGCAGGSCGGGY